MRPGTIVLTGLILTACGATGGGGVQAPAAVQGTWGADCSQPFVKFDGGQMTVFPDKATYSLKSASLQGGQLSLSYLHDNETITETYVQVGATLKLTKGVYGGQEVTWDKAPMTRCG